MFGIFGREGNLGRTTVTFNILDPCTQSICIAFAYLPLGGYTVFCFIYGIYKDILIS
jgi:hypothetical protein